MVSVLGGFVKWSHESYVFLFFMIIFRHVFCLSMRWKLWKFLSVSTSLNFVSSQSCVKTRLKKRFVEVHSAACVDEFWRKSYSFFNICAFRKSHDLLWHFRLQRFPAKSKMSVLGHTCCKHIWFPWLSGRIRRWNIEYE